MTAEAPAALSGRAAIGVLGALALVALMALLALAPPAARQADAPADRFAAGRAAVLVDRLAQAPHATGTAAHRAVREIITAELATLGLEPQIQQTTAVVQRGSTLVAARVANILARLPGTEGGPAVLLMAHYDTQPNTPGAGDDTAGVATILESVRALRAGSPLRHDVIALFTDAEEWGLLGARAFVDQHAWARDVGVVLNFESRGRGGVATMFETGPEGAALVRALRTTAAPVANSLSREVYRRMPNDTDFSVFRDAGIAGLNFAFIEGFTAYHTALDTPERLDPRSLQHHGSYALALTRHFGDRGIPPAAGEAVYFNPFGRTLVVYPATWAPLLALLVAGLVLGVVLRARRRELSWRDVARALVWGAAASVSATLAAVAVWWLLRRAAPSLVAGPYGMPYDAGFVALALLAAAVCAWSATLARPRVAVAGWLVAVALVWTALALVSAFALPGASYLFVWPALGLGCAALAATYGRMTAPLPAALVVGLAALPGVVLWTPLLLQLVHALTFGAIAVLGVAAALALSVLAPVGAALGHRRRFLWSCVALAVLAASAAAWPGTGPNRPRVDSLAYHLDADAEVLEARWLSFDRDLDAWTRRRLGAEAAPGPRPAVLGDGPPVWQAPATVAPLPRPRVETVLDLADGATDGGDGVGRSLSLFLISPRRAPVLRLEARSESAILGVWLDGTRYTFDDGVREVALRLLGMPAEGLALTVELAAAKPVTLQLVDQSFGLPVPPGESPEPRPPDAIARPGWWSDGTFVAVRETL